MMKWRGTGGQWHEEHIEMEMEGKASLNEEHIGMEMEGKASLNEERIGMGMGGTDG